MSQIACWADRQGVQTLSISVIGAAQAAVHRCTRDYLTARRLLLTARCLQVLATAAFTHKLNGGYPTHFKQPPDCTISQLDLAERPCH